MNELESHYPLDQNVNVDEVMGHDHPLQPHQQHLDDQHLDGGAVTLYQEHHHPQYEHELSYGRTDLVHDEVGASPLLLEALDSEPLQFNQQLAPPLSVSLGDQSQNYIASQMSSELDGNLEQLNEEIQFEFSGQAPLNLDDNQEFDSHLSSTLPHPLDSMSNQIGGQLRPGELDGVGVGQALTAQPMDEARAQGSDYPSLSAEGDAGQQQHHPQYQDEYTPQHQGQESHAQLQQHVHDHGYQHGSQGQAPHAHDGYRQQPSQMGEGYDMPSQSVNHQSEYSQDPYNPQHGHQAYRQQDELPPYSQMQEPQPYHEEQQQQPYTQQQEQQQPYNQQQEQQPYSQQHDQPAYVQDEYVQHHEHAQQQSGADQHTMKQDLEQYEQPHHPPLMDQATEMPPLTSDGPHERDHMLVQSSVLHEQSDLQPTHTRHVGEGAHRTDNNAMQIDDHEIEYKHVQAQEPHYNVHLNDPQQRQQHTGEQHQSPIQQQQHTNLTQSHTQPYTQAVSQKQPLSEVQGSAHSSPVPQAIDLHSAGIEQQYPMAGLQTQSQTQSQPSNQNSSQATLPPHSELSTQTVENVDPQTYRSMQLAQETYRQALLLQDGATGSGQLTLTDYAPLNYGDTQVSGMGGNQPQQHSSGPPQQQLQTQQQQQQQQTQVPPQQQQQQQQQQLHQPPQALQQQQVHPQPQQPQPQPQPTQRTAQGSHVQQYPHASRVNSHPNCVQAGTPQTQSQPHSTQPPHTQSYQPQKAKNSSIASSTTHQQTPTPHQSMQHSEAQAQAQTQAMVLSQQTSITFAQQNSMPTKPKKKSRGYRTGAVVCYQDWLHDASPDITLCCIKCGADWRFLEGVVKKQHKVKMATLANGQVVVRQERHRKCLAMCKPPPEHKSMQDSQLRHAFQKYSDAMAQMPQEQKHSTSVHSHQQHKQKATQQTQMPTQPQPQTQQMQPLQLLSSSVLSHTLPSRPVQPVTHIPPSTRVPVQQQPTQQPSQQELKHTPSQSYTFTPSYAPPQPYAPTQQPPAPPQSQTPVQYQPPQQPQRQYQAGAQAPQGQIQGSRIQVQSAAQTQSKPTLTAQPKTTTATVTQAQGQIASATVTQAQSQITPANQTYNAPQTQPQAQLQTQAPTLVNGQQPFHQPSAANKADSLQFQGDQTPNAIVQVEVTQKVTILNPTTSVAPSSASLEPAQAAKQQAVVQVGQTLDSKTQVRQPSQSQTPAVSQESLQQLASTRLQSTPSQNPAISQQAAPIQRTQTVAQPTQAGAQQATTTQQPQPVSQPLVAAPQQTHTSVQQPQTSTQQPQTSTQSIATGTQPVQQAQAQPTLVDSSV